MAVRRLSAPTQFFDRKEQAKKESYGVPGYMAGPIPAFLFDEGEMTPDELAMEIKRRYIIKRVQMTPRILLDMRLLRWQDPEKLQDQWQSLWTGKTLPKLGHNAGLSLGIYNWCKPTVESLVGLLAGMKPWPYDLDVPSEDEQSDAASTLSDIREKTIYRWRTQTEYLRTYQDGVGSMVSLGRWWREIREDPKRPGSGLPCTRNLWPGNVAGFWQEDLRTLEQVILARHMTVGEAIRMYEKELPEDERAAFRERVYQAVQSPTAAPGGGATVGGPWPDMTIGRQWVDPYEKLRYAQVTVLTCWFRGTDGKIGYAISLVGTRDAGGETDAVLLKIERDSKLSDIPLRCTPKYRVQDKPPDESQGLLFDIAPLNTEYNEMFSGFRDMLYRGIYPKYKAKGFTQRNAPKFIGQSAIYALPRTDQDLARIEEALNSVPVENFIMKLEDKMVVMAGLNKAFLGGFMPRSDTSSRAIEAAIHASIVRLEVMRTELQIDEVWMYRMWANYGHEFGSVNGFAVKNVLEGYDFEISLQWLDVSPPDATRDQQLALAAHDKGIFSTDTTMQKFKVLSRRDEMAKIRKEARDVNLRPERYSSIANALIEMARAKQAMQPQQGQGGGTRINLSLSGKLDPQATLQAERMVGIQGDPAAAAAMAAPSGGPPSTRAQGAMNMRRRQIAARSAPPSFETDNTPGGATGTPTTSSSIVNATGVGQPPVRR